VNIVLGDRYFDWGYPCLTCDPIGGRRRLGDSGVWGTARVGRDARWRVSAVVSGVKYPLYCPVHEPHLESWIVQDGIVWGYAGRPERWKLDTNSLQLWVMRMRAEEVIESDTV
jgi:hypothetical protein